MRQGIDPTALRKWAGTVERRLSPTPWTEIAHAMHAARRRKDIALRQKCAKDMALLNGGWKPSPTPCTCEWGDHKQIEVGSRLMCPIDVYLRLGRLALWGYRGPPPLSLYFQMLNKEQPDDQGTAA